MVVAAFLQMNDIEQRDFLDDIAKPKEKIFTLIRAFFQIIKDNSSNNELVFYSLVHLDGILEDRRSRVKYYIEIMNDFKNKLDLCGILISFLQKS